MPLPAAVSRMFGPASVPPRSLGWPLASSSCTVTVSLAPRSGSLTLAWANGCAGAPEASLAGAVPAMVAGSFSAVARTTVSGAFDVTLPFDSTVVIVVATPTPGATWWRVGVNTTASSAVLSAPGEAAAMV